MPPLVSHALRFGRPILDTDSVRPDGATVDCTDGATDSPCPTPVSGRPVNHGPWSRELVGRPGPQSSLSAGRCYRALVLVVGDSPATASASCASAASTSIGSCRPPAAVAPGRCQLGPLSSTSCHCCWSGLCSWSPLHLCRQGLRGPPRCGVSRELLCPDRLRLRLPQSLRHYQPSGALLSSHVNRGSVTVCVPSSTM